MTITTGATDDKYETKRTGLTLDEALEASVWGYRVRSPSLQPGAYVHYVFDGWRLQFVHNGREGSSSNWIPGRDDQLQQWEIVPLPSELKRDSWGRTLYPSTKGGGKSHDGWGRPV